MEFECTTSYSGLWNLYHLNVSSIVKVWQNAIRIWTAADLECIIGEGHLDANLDQLLIGRDPRKIFLGHTTRVIEKFLGSSFRCSQSCHSSFSGEILKWSIIVLWLSTYNAKEN